MFHFIISYSPTRKGKEKADKKPLQIHPMNSTPHQ